MSYRHATIVVARILIVLGISWPSIVAAQNATAPPKLSAQTLPPVPSPGTPPPATNLAAPAPMPGQAEASPSPKLPLPHGSRLSLKDAISIALKYHPLIAEASAESGAAAERVGEADSYLGPQVYGLSEYLRSTANGIGNTSYYNFDNILPRLSGSNHDLPQGDTSQSSDTSNDYAGAITVSQYLFDFGRRRGYVAQRRFEAGAANEEQQMVELQVIFEVSQRYFNLLQAKQLVGVYQEAVAQRKYHLHEAQVMAKAGLRPQLDVYLTEAEVQRAQLHLVDALNTEDDARAAFDNAIGLGGTNPDYQLVEVRAYAPVTASAGALMREGLNLRPDMKTLEDEAQAMGAQIRQYRSDMFPTVNGVAGYSAMGTGLPAANNFNVGIVITWPIFNSFLTTHQIAEARLRRKAVQGQIEDLRQRIILEIKTAFNDWQASVARIVRAERTLTASRVELELAEHRYKAGLSDVIELADAQRTFTNDNAAYANALYGYSVAEAAVDRATGRSLADLKSY